MTAKTSKSAESKPALTDAEVRDYLSSNGDFFERHPDLLDHLRLPHSSGSAVSLVERQISALRGRNTETRRQLGSLTDNARDNDRLYGLTRALVLALLDARSLDDLAAAFDRSMGEDFKIEHACMILFGEPRGNACRIEPAARAQDKIGGLLNASGAVCGVLREEELAYLFPGAGGIGSAAVVPLRKDGDLGVIAVGSGDPERYTSSMGTLFLEHIAEVAVRLIPRLQDDSP